MGARIQIYGYAFSCSIVRSRSRVFSVLWKAIMPDAHLIAMSIILNSIESHNAGWVYKQKKLESFDAGSALIVSGQHRTVPRVYLLPCYRESHAIFRVMHKPMCVYKWLSQAIDQIMVIHTKPSKVVYHVTVQISIWIIFDMKYERKDEYLRFYPHTFSCLYIC